MRLGEIIEKIEKEYPPELAYEWDNSGLFYGDKSKEISKVLVTLDILPEVVDMAIEEGAQMILAHHPIVMSGIKKLTEESFCGEMICKAIKNDIAIYSAHTNMDTAKNGINERLAESFGLEGIEVLEQDKPYPDCGLGRIGNLKKPITTQELAQTVKEKLNTPFVRVCGSKEKITKIAVASGSCSEYVPTAIEKGADAIITADMKYHNCLEFAAKGIVIVDAGHYPTEIIVCEMFEELLRECRVQVVKADYKDIFECY